MSDQGIGEKPAQHHDIALGEINHLGRLVDKDEPQSDQSIDTARRSAVDDELHQTCRLDHVDDSPLSARSMQATFF